MEKTRKAAQKLGGRGAFDRESVEALYKDPTVVDSYDEERFTSIKGRIRHALDTDAVVALLAPVRPRAVLDMATGTGRFADAVSGRLRYATVVAADNSPLMLARARGRTKRPTYVNANAFSLPFADGSFDAVVTFLFVRHFKKEDRKLLHAEIRRVLRPGGTLVIDVANRRYHEKAIADRHVFDEIYTRDEFAAEMAEAGFKVESLLGVPVSWPGLNRAISIAPTVRGKVFVARTANRLLRSRTRPTNNSAIWVARCRRDS